MHYVYLLYSERTQKFYVESSGDLRVRLNQHNLGQSVATSYGVPWRLVYYEAYTEKAFALDRERKLKQYGRGLVELKKRIGFF